MPDMPCCAWALGSPTGGGLALGLAGIQQRSGRRGKRTDRAFSMTCLLPSEKRFASRMLFPRSASGATAKNLSQFLETARTCARSHGRFVHG